MILIRLFFQNLVVTFLSGLVVLFLLIFLEALFHYPSGAFVSVLFPAFLFYITGYLIVALPVLPPLSLLIALVQWFFRKTKHGFRGFLLLRLHQVWIFLLIAAFFILIHVASMKVSLFFYIAAVFLGLFLFLLGRPRQVLGAFVLVLFICAGMNIKHWFDFSVPLGDEIPGKAHPNVLILLSDTTRQDHMSFYGYERNTTPNMKKLADNGVVFNNAYSTSSWTKPATASLLTSRFLTEDAIHYGAAAIEWRGLHLPEFFRRKGYDTLLLSANSNASSFYGDGKGYARRVHSLPPRHTALEQFVGIKFFNRIFSGKTTMKLKNIEVSLDEYLEALKIPPSQVSNFVHGSIEAGIPLEEKEKKRYQKILRRMIAQKAASELRYFPKLIPAQNNALYQKLYAAYLGILRFHYFDLEGADGEILSHWIKDRELADRFIHWLKRDRDQTRPFFAHLQIMGPHTPYATQPPHLLSHFDPDYPTPKLSPPTQHTPPSVPAPQLKPRQLQNMMANYDDAIRITDANLQRVIDHLEQSGELERTIIVFLSDHGEAFYEHNIYGHMNSLHAELVNIPLFFYWKDKLQAKRSDRPASIVDVAPSLITLAGYGKELSDLSDFQGKTLFEDNLQTKSNTRPDFEAKLATIVGGAWKMKRKKPTPFGIHRGVITSSGKMIQEVEENGKRTFYFPPADKMEDRSKPLDFDHPNNPPAAIDLQKKLPQGP